MISLPLSDIVIEIQKLLSNIKNSELTEEDSKKIIPFFINLSQQQVNNLALGFHGIYVDKASSAVALQNIRYLVPVLWNRVDEETRASIGLKYGKFIANNEQDSAKRVKGFLDLVNGFSYISEDIRIVEIETAVTNLLNVHHAMNNFYNEPEKVLIEELKGKTCLI